MRCIEIIQAQTTQVCRLWLTLTWDVLKWSIRWRYWECAERININMRCIEIGWRHCSWHNRMQININMRCIEIGKWKDCWDCGKRLTLTWDVLKYFFLLHLLILFLRLTLTWDVLKYQTAILNQLCMMD